MDSNSTGQSPLERLAPVHPGVGTKRRVALRCLALAVSGAALGPRASAPAYTTKSQYGQWATQKGKCTYRPAGGAAANSAESGEVFEISEEAWLTARD